MTRKVILYIAMSLDGYIAKHDGNIDFLSTVDSNNEDFGYEEFQKSIDTLIWGRKTYDKILSFGIDFPHRDKKCYVLSRKLKGKDDNVEFFNGEIKDLVSSLKEKDGKGIYIDGGAELVSSLLEHKLIDQMIISVIPYLLGSGIRLFREGRPEQLLSLKNSKTFPGGLVQITYDCVKS